MGAVGSFFGLAGGFNGTGVQVTPGTNAGQLAQNYTDTQSALQQQQALLGALQGQGGLGNQSQVYGQLQGVANGTGPNPAQAQLAQATGANVANQAALAASQRGAGANVGLLARQAAQTGAGAQQQAAGQAATLQAQQSLNALGQAGALANQQASNQIGQTNVISGAQQAEQGQLQNANTSYENAQSNAAGKYAGGGAGQAIGGAVNAAASAFGFADGGDVPASSSDSSNGPRSMLGKTLSAISSGLGVGNGDGTSDPYGLTAMGGMAGNAIHSLFAPSPQQPQSPIQMPSLGAQYGAQGPSLGVNTQLPSATFAKGGNVGTKLKSGGGVPGKAKKAGNSIKNDTVKAMLSPGEGVIDRETMGSPGAVGDAARFVMAYVNKKKAMK